MARVTTSNYQADADTIFQWATVDGDFFDRELDLSFLARALERHDHSANRGLPVSRVATGSIATASFAAGAVDTAAIGALQVTLAKMAANSVDATKLVAGTVVTHLGYTPVNKQGDTMLGDLVVSRGGSGQPTHGVLYLGQNGGLVYLFFDGTKFNLVGGDLHADHDLVTWRAGAPTTGYVHFSSAVNHFIGWDGTKFVADGSTIWHSGNDGAASTLDSDLLDGQHGAFYLARANHTGSQAAATISDFAAAGNALWAALSQAVPTGAIVMFRTAAELTAAGASWTAETVLAGRLPVGVGTTFTQTFVEATSYGSNWTPVTGLSSAATGGPTSTFPVAGGGTQVAASDHTHNAGAINGQGSVWLPPARGMVYGRKI